MNKILFTAALLSSTILWGCSEEKVKEVKCEPKVEESTTSGKMYQPSELALLMRTMHEELLAVKGWVKSGEKIPDSLNLTYEKIKTAHKTKGMGEGPEFNAFSTIFLTRMDSLEKVQDIETYNQMVQACLDCHNNYCPGPIPKIKKMKIKEKASE